MLLIHLDLDVVVSIEKETFSVWCIIIIIKKQESPPAWMQEACRPPHSCSVSQSPDWGGGYHHPVLTGGGATPIQSWWKTPPYSLKGGYLHPVLTGEEYPCPILMGVTPTWSWQGDPKVLPVRKNGGMLHQEEWGTPSPPSGRMGLPPSGRKGISLSGSMGVSPSADGIPPAKSW